VENHKSESEETFTVFLPKYAAYMTKSAVVIMLYCSNCSATENEEDIELAMEIENHDGNGRSFQCLSCGNLIGRKP